jgi:hypothetical protein
MDASKYVSALANQKLGVTQAQAIRMEIADALRDMADEIESGRRVVQEIQTFESAKASEPPISLLTVRSILKPPAPCS